MRNSTKALKSNWGVFDNQKTTMFLKKLLPTVQFNNPKPLELMKYLIEVTVPENSIILDFLQVQEQQLRQSLSLVVIENLFLQLIMRIILHII